MPEEPFLSSGIRQHLAYTKQAEEADRAHEQNMRGLEAAMTEKAEEKERDREIAEQRHAAQVHRERLGLRWTIIAGVVAILALLVSVIALVVSLTR